MASAEIAKLNFLLTTYNNSSNNNKIFKNQKLLYEYLSEIDALKQKQLPTVTVTNYYKTWRQKAKDISDRYSNDVFMRDTYQVFDFINEPHRTGAQSVYDFLKIYGKRMSMISNFHPVSTPGKGKIKSSLPTASGETQIRNTNGKNYSIFIDEGRVQPEELRVLDLQNVALIKVFENFVLADENGPAIIVYTKHAEDAKFVKPSNLENIWIKGYNNYQNFINPTKENISVIHKEDYRTTFYFAPQLFLNNKQKEIKLDFFNLNRTKSALFTIQGMTANGKLFYFQKKVTAE